MRVILQERRDLTNRYAFRSEKGQVIAVRLATPDKVRNLQRALYRRAKQSPKLQFHSLYDKVFRRDVLAHAFARCRANDGAAGPDGMTLASLDDTAVEAILTKVSKHLRWSHVSGHSIHSEYNVLAWAPMQPWSQDTAWAR